MAVYKICDSNVVDLVAGGSFRFSSLAYFRHLEEDLQVPEIGDAEEGLDTVHLARISEDFSEEDRSALAQVGVRIEGPLGSFSGLRVSNVRRITDCGPWLILCLSKQETLSLSDKGYDASVEISSLEQLARELWENGLVDGEPLQTFFSDCQYGDIEYVPRTADAYDLKQRIAASPFAKRERYASQQECRIALRPRSEWHPDVQLIKLPDPSDGLLRVSRRGPVGAQVAAAGPLPDHDFARQLLELSEEIARYSEETSRLAPSMSVPLGLMSQSDDEWRRHAERSRQAYVEFSEQRNERFVAEMRDRLMTAYWKLRERGVRGEWESEFAFPIRTPMRLDRAFKSMAEALSPGLVPRAEEPLFPSDFLMPRRSHRD